MSKRKFTNDQERLICKFYAAGSSTVQLGKAHNVHRSTINGILRRNGVRLRSSKESSGGLSPQVEADVCLRYLAGESTKKLGPIYGVSPACIRLIVKRHGHELRSNAEAHGGLCAEDVTEVCSRYLAGESSVSIAAAYDLSPQAVRKHLYLKGVRLRNYSEAKGGIPAELEGAICDRYIAGESLRQLSIAFNVSTNPISGILKRNGVDRRKPGGYGDSIQHVLDSTGYHSRPRECELYLCELNGHANTHCKVGIAFDFEERARHFQDVYGESVLRLCFASRAKAYLLEQAILDASRCHANHPNHLLGWAGASEVRSMPASDLEPIVLRLAGELEELGPWAFAATYVPMTAAQRALCQQRASISAPLSSFS